MSFRGLLDSEVDIKRESTVTDDLGGGGAVSYSVLYRRVPCRFETLTKKLEIIAYDQTAIFPDYYVYLEYRSGVIEGDHIILGGREFEIKLIEDWSEQGQYMKLAVVELKRNK